MNRPVPGVARWSGGPARRVAALAVLGGLAVLPVLLSSYAVSSLARILAFALLAVSLDLLVGYAGLPSLGQAAYFGVGAYAAALVGVHLTTFAPAQLLAALAAGALAAAVTGWVAVRARGTYFLMITLALGAIVHQLAQSWTPVTGGSNGLAGIPSITLAPGGAPVTLAGVVYWYVLAGFVVFFLAVRLVAGSPFGRTLRGIRDNEPRMRALGYATVGAKYVAFCVCGAVAGVAGSLWVAQARFVSPADLSFEVAVLVLLAVVVGGTGTLWGPCVGAAIVLAVRDHLSTYLAGRGPLLLGLAFVLAVYLLPGGLAGIVPAVRGRAVRRSGREGTAAPVPGEAAP